MEEILHHLGCIKPVEIMGYLPYRLVSRISAINSNTIREQSAFFHVSVYLLLKNDTDLIHDMDLLGVLSLQLARWDPTHKWT